MEADVEFAPTVATSVNVARSVLRSMRNPLSSCLLSVHARAICDLDSDRAVKLLGASVTAEAIAEYDESPPLLKARNDGPHSAAADPEIDAKCAGRCWETVERGERGTVSSAPTTSAIAAGRLPSKRLPDLVRALVLPTPGQDEPTFERRRESVEFITRQGRRR
jgi:hypothetical protein